MTYYKTTVLTGIFLLILLVSVASQGPLVNAEGPAVWRTSGNFGTDPTVNFIGTTDNQPLVVKTNNVEQIRITPDGKVGIGTASPGPFKLEVNGTTKISGGVIAEFFQGTPTANVFSGGFGAPPLIIFGDDGTSFQERMRVTSSGNVGIGTTNPGARLDVNGNIRIPNNQSIAGNSGNAIGYLDIAKVGLGNELIIGHGNNANLQFVTGGTGGDTSMTIANGGNVGIGLEDPQRNLHISDVMRLEPRGTAPDSPSIGDIYVDSDTNELCFYDGSSWTGLKAAGTCA